MNWRIRATAAQPRHELSVGDPAPPLVVSEFLKGEPYRDLRSGTVHVVDLWGSGCGVCKTTIPQLSALQVKYPDVVFLGVAILEHDIERCRAIVGEFGDKLRYRIAVEAAEASRDGLWALPSGAMTRDWYEAACLPGVPETFIVDTQGRIAWWGHPSGVEAPLDAVIAGTWDIEAARHDQQERYRREATRERFWLMQDYWPALTGNEGAQSALRLLDEELNAHPVLRNDPILQSYRLTALSRIDNRADEFLAFAETLANSEAFSNAPGLYAIGCTIIQVAAGRRAFASQGLAVFRRLEALLASPGQTQIMSAYEAVSLELWFLRALIDLGHTDEATVRLPEAKARIEATTAPQAYKEQVLSQIAELMNGSKVAG